MTDHLKFYIDGQWVDPIGTATLDVINPATEESIGRIAMGNAEDVNRAVAAARRAFETFSRTTKAERIALLERPLIPRPGPGEGMFHVEHRPVEPATTAGRTLLDQFVGVRVQGLHWKRQSQFGHGSGGGAIQARDRTAALAPFAADLETQGMDRAG